MKPWGDLKPKEKGIRALVVSLAIIVPVVFVWLFANFSYTSAVENIHEGEFARALKTLSRLPEDYRNTKPLTAFCRARIALDEGDPALSKQLMGPGLFHNASNRLRSPERYEIPDEFAAYYTDWEAAREALRTPTPVPTPMPTPTIAPMPMFYMDEADIGKTAWGEPDEMVVEIAPWHPEGEPPKQTHVYHFYQDGKLALTVRCEDGKVWYVIDELHPTPIPVKIPRARKTEVEEDPYNVSDYSNAEDFYDENYDEFPGYEDAETYYNDHGGI